MIEDKWVIRGLIVLFATWEILFPTEGDITIGKHLAIFIVIGFFAWLFALVTVSWKIGRVGARYILTKLWGNQ